MENSKAAEKRTMEKSYCFSSEKKPRLSETPNSGEKFGCDYQNFIRSLNVPVVETLLKLIVFLVCAFLATMNDTKFRERKVIFWLNEKFWAQKKKYLSGDTQLTPSLSQNVLNKFKSVSTWKSSSQAFTVFFIINPQQCRFFFFNSPFFCSTSLELWFKLLL